MTKRELLESYRLLVIEINSLEKQSAFLNQYIGGPRPVRAVQLTGMPRGTNNPEAAMIQRADYDDAIITLERKCEELRDLLSEFEKVIEAVSDQYDRIILRNYYALGWTDRRIGEEIGFDKSTVWKRRTKAISELDG
jgi:DNA-directed RNA polymerase specialized sigma subunit